VNERERGGKEKKGRTRTKVENEGGRLKGFDEVIWDTMYSMLKERYLKVKTKAKKVTVEGHGEVSLGTYLQWDLNVIVNSFIYKLYN